MVRRATATEEPEQNGLVIDWDAAERLATRKSTAHRMPKQCSHWRVDGDETEIAECCSVSKHRMKQ